MTSLISALDRLRQDAAGASVPDRAITAIRALVSGQSTGRHREQRTISSAGRRRISVAQKARWPKFKRPKPGLNTSPSSTPRMRTMSAAGRRRIAAAQRARWAKWNAHKSGLPSPLRCFCRKRTGTPMPLLVSIKTDMRRGIPLTDLGFKRDA